MTARGLPEEEIRKRVQEAAETLELTEHLTGKTGEPVRGQRQRVAMGRAIVRVPMRSVRRAAVEPRREKLRGQMRMEILVAATSPGITTVYGPTIRPKR